MPSVPGFMIGGGTASIAVADLTDAEATGEALVRSATPSTARAVMGGRVADPMTGAGWSALAGSGGASATWASGPTRLALAVPASTVGEAGVEQAGYIPEADAWDVIARFDVTAGDASSSTRLGLSAGQSATDLAACSVWTDGTIELGYVVSGVYTAVAFGGAAGLDSSARTGGQAWLRLSKRSSSIAVAWGVGTAGAVPTVWRTVYQSSSEAAIAAACGTYTRVTAATTDVSVASGLTVDILAIRATGQSGGAL